MSNITRLSESTHKLEFGAVSYSLVLDIFWDLETFLSRMKYIVDTVPDDGYSESHIFLEELIKAADQERDSYFDKVKAENEALGGNGNGEGGRW